MNKICSRFNGAHFFIDESTEHFSTEIAELPFRTTVTHLTAITSSDFERIESRQKAFLNKAIALAEDDFIKGDLT